MSGKFQDWSGMIWFICFIQKTLSPEWWIDLHYYIISLLLFLFLLFQGTEAEAGRAVRSFYSDWARHSGPFHYMALPLCLLKSFLEFKGFLEGENASSSSPYPPTGPAMRHYALLSGGDAVHVEWIIRFLTSRLGSVFYIFVFLIHCILSVPQLRLKQCVLGVE